MEPSVIEISPDGLSVKFLYQDGHPCLELGKAEMIRASNVRWSKEDQEWKVWLIKEDGSEEQIGFGFVGRTDAVAAEIVWLNKMLESKK